MMYLNQQLFNGNTHTCVYVCVYVCSVRCITVEACEIDIHIQEAAVQEASSPKKDNMQGFIQRGGGGGGLEYSPSS